MWSGIAMGAAALGSAVIGSQASKNAAGQGVAAADRASQAQAGMYAQMRGDLAPYREGGTPALQRLMYLTGVGGGLNSSDPRYKAMLDPMLADLDQQHMKRFGMSMYDARADAGGRQANIDQVTKAANDQYVSQYGSSESSNDPAYGSLVKPFDFGLADMYRDPGYQFRVSEGEKALTRGSAARGLAQSTPGLKALMNFNQESASQEYGASFGRAMGVDTYNRQNQFNTLSFLAGTGQNAAAMTGQAGVNTGAGVANSMIAGGQAQAAGTMGSASAINNAFQGGLGNYMYMQRFNQLMQRMPVFSQAPAANSGGGYSMGEMAMG